MQLNCKVIKKWQLPPISIWTLPFQGYPPFIAKCILGTPPPKWLNFWRVLPPPLIMKEGESNYAARPALDFRGNYMKIHFASAFPRQCFCRGWQDFVKSLGIYLGNLGKNFDEKETCKVVPFTPYFTKNKKYYVCNYCCAICCTNIVICNAMCSFLTLKIVLKIISDALFKFKKDKYEKKMLNILKNL